MTDRQQAEEARLLVSKMPVPYSLNPREDIQYYGKSDLLAQIADELRNCPDSCFSLNVIAWYNAEYSALSGVEGCSYQVAIDEEKCPDSEDSTPETIEDVIDIVTGFLEGKPRRVARALIGIICRQLRRNNVVRTAPSTP